MGRIQMMRGEHDVSIRALEKSISLNPSFSRAYFGLGMVLPLAGRLDNAKAAGEQVERLSPRDPMLWVTFLCHVLADTLSGDHQSVLHWVFDLSSVKVERPRQSLQYPR